LTQGRRNMLADFWWENLKENIHLENHGVDVDLKEIVWLGFVWHSIGTYDELL